MSMAVCGAAFDLYKSFGITSAEEKEKNSFRHCLNSKWGPIILRKKCKLLGRAAKKVPFSRPCLLGGGGVSVMVYIH